jgi:hypothetical protein
LRQYFHIGIDVRPESDFDNVISPIGSQSANSLSHAFPSQQNFIRSSTRSDFLITFRAESCNHPRSGLMRDLPQRKDRVLRLSPFNWEGQMWDATNSGTFSLSYNDGTFSAQGSFDSAGNFGEIGFERNGAFAEHEHAANFLGATEPTAISPTSLTAQNQHDLASAQNTQGVQQPPRGPKFRGKIPIRELIR